MLLTAAMEVVRVLRSLGKIENTSEEAPFVYVRQIIIMIQGLRTGGGQRPPPVLR